MSLSNTTDLARVWVEILCYDCASHLAGQHVKIPLAGVMPRVPYAALTLKVPRGAKVVEKDGIRAWRCAHCQPV